MASFLASSVAIKFPETNGKPFINASNSEYLPFIKHPILIYKAATGAELTRALKRAKERELAIGIYIELLFATKNLVEVAKYSDDEQPLAGTILYGENKKVSKALDGLKFHP